MNVKLQNPVTKSISVNHTGATHRGWHWTDRGMAHVQGEGASKATHLGGLSRSPGVLARLTLSELVQEHHD
jgi:hypothetical protein